MADELAKQHEVQVIGPGGAAALKPQSVILTETPLKPLPLFLLMAFSGGVDYLALETGCHFGG